MVRNYFTKYRWMVVSKKEWNKWNEFVVVIHKSVARTPDINVLTSGKYLSNSKGVRNEVCCRNMRHKNVRNVELDPYLMATW